MILSEKMKRRLKLNRPSLRARARPPKQRSMLGAQFTAANLPCALSLQHCKACGHVQYPPTELCGVCLEDALTYRATAGDGELLARSELHHSLWEFFKRRIGQRGRWPMGSVKLSAGPVVLVHIADDSLTPGTPVQVFSHSDASQSVVLIAVASTADITTPKQRTAIAEQLQLTHPARRDGGI